jgi:hypothetical protein
MRIIKLNVEKEFPSLADVRRYFLAELPYRKPRGKFLIPTGWIAKEDGMRTGEQLVFTYKAIPVFTAYALTGVQENLDEEAKVYPVFFEVDVSTIKEVADADAKKGLLRNLAKGEGWNRLEDTDQTRSIWSKLR